MKSQTVFEGTDHRWSIIYGQEEDGLVDSNIYVVEADGEAMIVDPGGLAIFPQAFVAVSNAVDIDHLRAAFVSHQDPNIASSIAMWAACLQNLRWYVPQIWEGFIRHFGALDTSYVSIPDAGMQITLGNKKLDVVPAHYLHSPGNFHLYDAAAKVLFSGDVGASMLPPDHGVFMGCREREDGEVFDENIKHATFFHKRWMASMEAKRDWCERVSRLEIDFLCPQHGVIYTGKNVERFINWFADLKVGYGAW